MAGERVRRLVSSLSSNNVDLGTNGTKTARSILAEVGKNDGASYTHLWDGLDVCLEQASGTKQSTKSLANCFVQWSACEREYIKNLPFTKKKFELPACEVGSIGETIDTFCSSFSKIAETRARLSSVVGAMGTQLHQFRREQNQTKRQLEIEGVKLRKGMIAQEQVLQRAKAKYEKACTDAELCISLKERAHKEKALHEVSKLWQRTTDALIVVQESEQQYRMAVLELQEYRSKYTSEMKRVLGELQILEESRIEYTKALIHGVTDSYTELFNQFDQILSDLRTKVDNTDTGKDIEQFVQSNLGPPFQPVEFEKHKNDRIFSEIEILVGGGGVSLNPTSCSSTVTTPTRSASPKSLSSGSPHSSFSASATNATTRRHKRSASEATPETIQRAAVTPPAFTRQTSDNNDSHSISYAPQQQNTRYVRKNNSETANFVIALFKYASQEETELSFSVGDVIQVVEKDESGWWEGRLKNGQEGSFPENYCKVITQAQAESKGFFYPNQQQQKPGDSYKLNPALSTSPPSSSTSREHEEQVIVLFDYIAQDPGDLTIKKRQILTVYHKEKESGWLEACDGKGNKGNIPANYVRKYKPESALSA